MRTAIACALAWFSIFATGRARAQSLADAPAGTALGGQGQVAVSSDFSLGFSHQGDNSTLSLAPAADYFFMPQVSLGGQVLFRYDSWSGGSRTTVGLAPRIGYNLPLTPMFSLFARAGFSFTHEGDSNHIGIFLSAPFLFHPAPHFFVGLGPSLGGNITGGGGMRVALESTVGGYFDW